MVLSKRQVRRAWLAALLLTAVIYGLAWLAPIPEHGPWSREVLADDGTLLNAYLSSDEKWRLSTTVEEVSPELLRALLQKEDKWFSVHPGVNPVAAFRALIDNLREGEVVSGASTITMQVARLLEPAERTIGNKLLEMLRAVQLELLYSKEEILNLYLSLLPYGGNVEGVKAASWLYFGKSPAQLSLSQVVTLTVIPNDPNALRLDRNSTAAKEERDRWLRAFKRENVFPSEEIEDALTEPLSGRRYAMPAKAPHLSRVLATRSDNNRIHSSIAPSVQLTAEKILAANINNLRTLGITNGAVLVIENATMEAKAYCGSADFTNDRDGGQVNGVTALRSPGSALKPALYALAFDKGAITPRMRLNDIPADFGGYRPENYTEEFEGPVTAAYALAHSLNVPAVKLLEQVGLNEFLKLLRKSGFSDIERRGDMMGLSVILGGCGVTLEELTGLYTAFANGGVETELRYTTDADTKDKTIYSAASSFLIAQILTGHERPDFPANLVDLTRLPRIAWKTGTSYGRRDGWAVGFNPQYTIGVWTGNFDGSGSPHLSGAESAVPLLFDLFNAIGYDPEERWFSTPAAIGERSVCSRTGLIPSAQCPSEEDDYYIRETSPQNRCELMKPVYISSDSASMYTPECLPDDGYTRAWFPVYEPELALFFDAHGISYEKPPPLDASCKAAMGGAGPAIVSPSPDYDYLLERGAGQEILLQAASDSRVKEHYWFIDDAFFAKAKPGERLFYQPQSDELDIVCLDEYGRKSSLEIHIVYY